MMKSNFLINKYSKWYFNIIGSALANENRCVSTEIHHILPKCIGGSNCQENLVKLTFREHFLCHWLLTKMVDETAIRLRLSFALHMFRTGNDKYRRTPLSSRQFAVIKNVVKKNQIGRKLSDEHRQKISKAHTGKKHSEEHCKKVSLAYTEEKRRIHSEALKGKITHDQNTRSKISETQKRSKVNCKFIYLISHESGIIIETLSLKDFCKLNNFSRSSFGRTLINDKFINGFKIISKLPI